MKSLRIAAAIIFLAGFVLFFFGTGRGWAQGMMNGEGMRGMMQNMMGDMLPPMDPAQLPDPGSKGARLLQQYCTQCHNLPGPGLHTAEEWPAVVERMVRRMRRMSGRGMMMGMSEIPTVEQADAITAYLQMHSLRPLSERESQELETPGGRTFKEVCSRCHVLPNPDKHTGLEWPAVVGRMKGYMESMGKAVPQEKEMREIVRFLQRHGKRGSDRKPAGGR